MPPSTPFRGICKDPLLQIYSTDEYEAIAGSTANGSGVARRDRGNVEFTSQLAAKSVAEQLLKLLVIRVLGKGEDGDGQLAFYNVERQAAVLSLRLDERGSCSELNGRAKEAAHDIRHHQYLAILYIETDVLCCQAAIDRQCTNLLA